MWAAVEGCIGVGKTTLAKFLAERYGGTPLIEEAKKHPFIAEFYLNPTAYAFETEMGFALIHYHQLHRAQREGLFNRLVFSDFAFDKDRLFADLTLRDAEEQRLFGFTYDFFKRKIPALNLLICLKAPTEFLFERVKRRARKFEAEIPFGYLDRVNAKYNEFFDSYDQSEKIIFNALDLDVAEGGSALQRTVIERVVPRVDRVIRDSKDA